MLGVLKVIPGKPDKCIDVVPVDVVINSALAVAKQITTSDRNDVNIFNCVTCNVRPWLNCRFNSIDVT